jgi:hypothetical protein
MSALCTAPCPSLASYTRTESPRLSRPRRPHAPHAMENHSWPVHDYSGEDGRLTCLFVRCLKVSLHIVIEGVDTCCYRRIKDDRAVNVRTKEGVKYIKSENNNPLQRTCTFASCLTASSVPTIAKNRTVSRAKNSKGRTPACPSRTPTSCGNLDQRGREPPTYHRLPASRIPGALDAPTAPHLTSAFRLTAYGHVIPKQRIHEPRFPKGLRA